MYNVQVETKVEYSFVVEATEKKNSCKFSQLSLFSYKTNSLLEFNVKWLWLVLANGTTFGK